ncbi:hypothetical protein AB0M34_23235 [Nocardia sp. NPDC050193]
MRKEPRSRRRIVAVRAADARSRRLALRAFHGDLITVARTYTL